MTLQKYFPVFAILFTITTLIADQKEDEQQIKKATEAYIEAFNRLDSKAVASFWATDAEYLNPETGELLNGREEIEKSFDKHFKSMGTVKLEVKINSITFPTKDTALVVGTFHVKHPGEETLESAFKTLYEKQDGKWEIGEVRDVDIAQAPNQYQHLKDLEWLIGEWVDTDKDVEISTSYKWDKYKNFIFSKFSINTEGTFELEGSQIIGWDPINNKIRSWLFDSDGGFGESTWTKKGNSWVVETAQTLADGSRASSINIFTPIDANSYTYESSGREVGGKLLPNIEPIIIKKKNG